MKTLNEVFDQYKDNPGFRWMITANDLTDEQLVSFLRAHDCNANADEAISFLAGLLSDVDEEELAEDELAVIAAGRPQSDFNFDLFKLR